MTNESLVRDARAFLSDLAANNTRDWFTEHKASYDARLKAPALALLDQVAADLETRTGRPVETKLWRPHRDLRFSKDKTPYHVHLHIGWTQGRGAPGWVFGISPDYVSAGAGFFAFDKPALAAWRAGIDGPGGAEMAAAIDTARATGTRVDPPELKRVPKPFAHDHPRAALLRRKGLMLWHDFKGDGPRDLRAGLIAVFDGWVPALDRLRRLL